MTPESTWNATKADTDLARKSFQSPRAAPLYWYRRFVGECAVCGRDASYRVRVYGRPPDDPRERYVHLPDTATYCGCLER